MVTSAQGDGHDGQMMAETCEDCGEYVPVGGWPFCASAANPAGHTRGGAYDFKMHMSMKANGWSRRER